MKKISIGYKSNKKRFFFHSKYLNRHGIIAGATGTGKTVTLQTFAEKFSRSGIPVFLTDIKGDASGLAISSSDSPIPVVLWDCFGEAGLPAKIKVSDVGPDLMSRLLELTDAQAGCLEVAFSYAESQHIQLNTLWDIKKVLSVLLAQKDRISANFGLVSPSSIAAIQRSILRLERMRGNELFNTPTFDIDNLLRKENKRGIINILSSDELIKYPQLYAMFMVWLLMKLYSTLPEVGDLSKPRLALFIDEAHLLFADCPAFIFKKIEQIVRLIRSKGVGIYFVTQSPTDIPTPILGQLGNRVQHALRVATAADHRAIKAVSNTFPVNPSINVADTITSLKIGHALVSVIDENGQPSPVEIVKVDLPNCRLGPLSLDERTNVITNTGWLLVKDISKCVNSSLFSSNWPWCPKKSMLTWIAGCVVMSLIAPFGFLWGCMAMLLSGIYVYDFFRIIDSR